MNINILGICGSPRKGNTFQMVKKALEAAHEVQGISTSFIHVRGKISPCLDCNKCPVNPPEKFCIISDKMDEIYPKLIEADGIIIGSPVYFGTVTAQTKAFMDRCRPLGRAGSLLRFKVGGAVAVGGSRHAGQEKTLSAIIDYFLMSGMCPIGLGTPPEVGACGVAFNLGKIIEDNWYHEAKKRNVSALDEAYQLGRTVALMSKIVKSGLKEVDILKELEPFKLYSK